MSWSVYLSRHLKYSLSGSRFKLLRAASNCRILSFFLTSPTSMMSSQLEQLQQERQQLETKIQDLVDKLEERKNPDKVKVPKDAILRSKEDREITAAMEKLDFDAEPKPSSEAQPNTNLQPKKGNSKETLVKKNKGSGSKDSCSVDRAIDVSRLDLRIGKILEVDRHPDADSLYVEKIDCGDPTGPRTVISGLVKHVPIEEMKERYVVVLCNLKPAKMRGILSEAMVMCASTPEKVELLQPPHDVKPGDRVVFEDFPGEPDSQLNPKKKIWETVSPDIKTNNEGIAMYKSSEFKVIGNEGKFKSTLANVNIR